MVEGFRCGSAMFHIIDGSVFLIFIDQWSPHHVQAFSHSFVDFFGTPGGIEVTIIRCEWCSLCFFTREEGSGNQLANISIGFFSTSCLEDYTSITFG